VGDELIVKGRAGSVLVVGMAETRAFLSVVRSLGRAGLEVHVVAAPLDAPALRSRYIHAIHPMPAYKHGSDAWLQELKEILERESFDLVIPCDDTAIIPFQLNRAALQTLPCQIYLLNEKAYAATIDKQQSYALVEALDIPRPRQIEINSLEELGNVGSLFGFPLIIKPISSFTVHNLSAKRIVSRVRDDRELLNVGSSILHDGGSLLVQEFFKGVGVGVEVLCKDGKVLVAFQHRRLHEPQGGGGSSYRRSERLAPELLEATRRIMAALQYTGVCMAEFLYNKRENSWVFVELNGRFWGSLPLAIAAGVDFPLYLYQMLCHGQVDFPTAYNEHLYCRNWKKDLGWLGRGIQADIRKSPFKPASLVNFLAGLANIPLLRERNDTFVLDDPAPAVHEFRHLLDLALAIGTAPVLRARQRMRNRMLKRSRDCQAVLFLCKGNICRSPFASKLFAHRTANSIRVLSAGFHPSGRNSPEAAIDAARSWDIDLAIHRSAVITEEMLCSSDIVFAFDFYQVVTLREMFPSFASKVVLLGALDEGPLEIPDPFGGNADDFQKVYARIDSALSAALSYLPPVPLATET